MASELSNFMIVIMSIMMRVWPELYQAFHTRGVGLRRKHSSYHYPLVKKGMTLSSSWV